MGGFKCYAENLGIFRWKGQILLGNRGVFELVVFELGRGRIYMICKNTGRSLVWKHGHRTLERLLLTRAEGRLAQRTRGHLWIPEGRNPSQNTWWVPIGRREIYADAAKHDFDVRRNGSNNIAKVIFDLAKVNSKVTYCWMYRV